MDDARRGSLCSPMAESAPILSFFWDLASVDAAKRVHAGDLLLQALTKSQGSGTDASSDLTYTIKRLVRGLASSRDAARQGFGAVLIEVLITHASVVRIEDVLDLMDSTMQLQGSMDGQEERDMLFGRLFTCASVLRCKQLSSMLAERQSAVATRVSKELLFCFGKKTFLQEMAVVLLSELVDQLPPAEVQRLVWPHVAPLLASPVQEWSAHALFITLRLCRVLPHATMTALLPHAPLRSGTLLHAANLPLLVAPFKSASSVHPRLHCVWDEALGQICGASAATDAAATPAPAAADAGPGGDAKKKKKKKSEVAAAAAAEPPVDDSLLRAFWQSVVEEGLVPSTLERKYMAFMLLQQVPATRAPWVFHGHFRVGRSGICRAAWRPRHAHAPTLLPCCRVPRVPPTSLPRRSPPGAAAPSLVARRLHSQPGAAALPDQRSREQSGTDAQARRQRHE